MSLVLVELPRLRWRRAVQLLVLVAFLLPVVIWGGTTWDTRPVGEAEVAAAKALAAEDQRRVQEQFDECAADPDALANAWGYPAGTPCEEMLGVPGDVGSEYVWYLPRQPLEFASLLQDSGVAAALLVVALMMLVGATFAGADWASGSMANQLLFESRRMRVWAAKAIAVTLSAFLVTLLALSLFWGLCALVVALRDIDASGAQWADAWFGVLRAAAVAGAAALGGFALTMLFRNTIATLGLMFVVAVGSSLLIQALPLDDPERWMLHANGLAVLADGYTYWAPCHSDMCEPVELFLPMSHGLAYFGVALVGLVVASLWSFRRRDVP